MYEFDVYALGNALVDREYHVDDSLLAEVGLDKGMMTLIDADRRHQLLALLDARYPCLQQACGGSAANSIVAVAALGGRAFYACRVADDALGEFYHRDLRAAGVACRRLEPGVPGHTGTCLVLVSDDAERTMATHLGATADFAASDLDETHLISSRWLYIEGYLASSDSARAAVARARHLARAHDIPIALTFSDPAMTLHFRQALRDMIDTGVDLLFCNEEEARLFSGEASLERALPFLLTLARRLVITRGAQGALIVDAERRLSIPAPVVQAIDSNGAGDAFAGTFLYGITHDLDAEHAAHLAARVAAQVVSRYGPRLPLATYAELLTP